MAYHAQPRHDARRATPRDILRAIRQRVAERVRYEHTRANYAATHARDQRAWRRFHSAWVATGVATLRKGATELNIFRTAHQKEPPKAGEVHIRVAAAYRPARGKQPPSSGWALTAHDVAADGGETLQLRASGAIPATATHGGGIPAYAPRRHTGQAAQHMAAVAALAYAQQLAARGVGSVISTSNGSVVRSARAARARPNPAPKGSHAGPAQEIGRRTAEAARHPTASTRFETTPTEPITLSGEAAKAALRRDIKAHVRVATAQQSQAVSLWDESRVWDPGD